MLSSVIIYLRRYYFVKQSNNNTVVIGFFHPNCSSGGGGERVLWKIIQALSDLIDNHKINISIVIYTIDKLHESYHKDVLHHVSSRFSINIPHNLPLKFIQIAGNGMDTVTNGKKSMISQTFETLKLCWNGLIQLTPDVYVDTTGCAFTFVIAKMAGCKVGAYVHYPTISTDMLALVWSRRPLYNNDAKITSNALYSYVKLVYYTLFAMCYGMVGSLASLVMVNSTWTFNHIRYLWRFSTTPIHIVYPPCDTKDLSTIEFSQHEMTSNDYDIISIGQFRPEKDHELQIRSFALLLKMLKDDDDLKDINPRLILIGSCRSQVDHDRVNYLKNYAKQQNINDDSIAFTINQDYSVLKSYLSKATIGLHTMWNEHFGISVVEMMAAGVITIAHDSGGPKSDIINNGKTGYLATTNEQYAVCMKDVLRNEMYDKEVNRNMRYSARESASRFSDQVFDESFKEILLSSGLLKK